MAALSLASVWGGRWLFHKQNVNPETLRGQRRPLRLKLLYAGACMAALSHLLLDYTTSYGIRLFEPFSFKWYSGDIVFFVEPFMWLALGLGLALPMLFEVKRKKIEAEEVQFCGRAGAIFALIAVALMWGFRHHQHRHAVAELNAHLYHGEKPIRASAYPYMWNPFVWRGVVETWDFFETVRLDNFHDDAGLRNGGRMYYKPKYTPAITAAQQSRLGRVYLDWTRYPIIEAETEKASDAAYRVYFCDLRSIYPLKASVDLDRDLHVLVQRLGRRAQE